MNYTIPAEINSWTRLATAQYYHHVLGMAVHPLYASDKGDEKERGKKPLTKDWRNHTASEVTDDYLQHHFGNGSNHNIGIIVRAPFVHIDLDSKPDAGESVRAWLAMQPQLAGVPRERTGGGAHLSFICRDLPESVARPKKAITMQVNRKVTAELYTDGMNLVVSPSVHKSGAPYSWDVTGEIPEVSWAQIRQWFGFAEPEAAKRGRPAKEKPWWARFKGDLRTLDAVALFKEAGLLGECINPDEGKWSARCPWQGDHSDAKGGNGAGTDTVIFQKESGENPPGFKCLHAHCANRTIQHVLCALDDATPGIVDRRCREMRVWAPGARSPDGRPRVVLPGIGRPDSEFVSEVGSLLAPRERWFTKGDEIVCVGEREFSEGVKQLAFHPVEPVSACTDVEQHVEVGITREDEFCGDNVFVPCSMTRETAAKMLAAPQFISRMPRIVRILDVPIPVRLRGVIVLPKVGYDPALRTWLPENAPIIRPMPFADAVAIIREVYCEFCWADKQSLVHAIARLITPFCRGIIGWQARTPLWCYQANQPGAGKDYCADVVHVTYTGNRIGDAPLGKDGEEIRKRLTTILNSGRRFTHFANCQVHIEDQTFIGLITSPFFSARNLGSTDSAADLMLPNEGDYSLSANMGLTFREDLERRLRRITLFLAAENQNKQVFKREDLLGWIGENRATVLSAIASLVTRWMVAGEPKGSTPFASFPEWSRVVGGVMAHAGLGDPCLAHTHDELETGGDRSMRAMRALYRISYNAYPEAWFEKGDLFKLLASEDNDDLAWFGSFCDEEVRSTKTKIGIQLRKFRGRELDGVVLQIDGSQTKSERQPIRFVAAASVHTDSHLVLGQVFGDDGNLGDVPAVLKTPENNSHKKKAEGGDCSVTAAAGMRAPQAPQPPQPLKNGFRSADLAAFPEIASAIESAGSVALDIETYGPGKKDGLNPWRGDIRLLSLKIAGRDPWVIDLCATGYDLGPLAAALEAVMVIGHNLKFDALWLAVKCGIRLRKVFCTLTAARLLSAGTKPGNDLNNCLERYLGIKPDADQSTSDWAAKFLTAEQLTYAARDVAHLHALQDVLVAELGQAGLKDVSMLEMELLPVVVAMEQTGIAVNRRDLERIERESKQKQTAIAAQLSEALSVPDLNPNSTNQLQSALNKAGVKVPNTSAEALKGSGDTCYVPLILEYKAAKSQAQQAASLFECIAPDGRIHGRFEPTGTATGRFSSKEPNLQNIGRGALRECFVAPAGSKLVVADYSQIELRAAAAIAGETKMIEAYRRGEDLHRGTAAAVLGKAPDKVTKEDRQLAKAVNFGLLYGQSAPGLVKYAASSYGVTLSEAEAKAIRSRFFGTYVKLRQWHERSRRTADNGVGEVRTALGRRRLIPPSASEWERFTALVNTPVQGGCADGMKRAIVLLATKLPPSAHIISTVHDEIIVETPESEAEEVLQLIKTVMVESMAALYPQVPIEVEAHVCANWGEK